MFPALLLYRSLVPVRVKTEATFTAEDPWNQNRRTLFTVEAYVKTFKGATPRPGFKSPLAMYLYGIRSEVDGVERMLPASLSELWRSNRVPVEALPKLLKEIEPTLKKADYRPAVGKKRLAVAAGLLWIALGFLTLFPLLIALTTDDFPLLSAIPFTLVIGAFSWLYLYLMIYRAKWRRMHQQKWILARQ